MEIKKLVLGPLQTNCYIVINGDNCIIIDPAYDGEKITNFLKQNFLNLKAIFSPPSISLIILKKNLLCNNAKIDF